MEEEEEEVKLEDSKDKVKMEKEKILEEKSRDWYDTIGL